MEVVLGGGGGASTGGGGDDIGGLAESLMSALRTDEGRKWAEDGNK